MFEWIKHIVQKTKASVLRLKADRRTIPGQPGFIWCLVGNIADIQRTGEDGKIRTGTKHFSPGTKVFCFPAQWGDGYESIRVIGLHRRSRRRICIIINSKGVTNWRLQKVYNPQIIEMMRSKRGWTDSDDHRETILEMLKWLPERASRTDK